MIFFAGRKIKLFLQNLICMKFCHAKSHIFPMQAFWKSEFFSPCHSFENWHRAGSKNNLKTIIEQLIRKSGHFSKITVWKNSEKLQQQISVDILTLIISKKSCNSQMSSHDFHSMHLVVSVLATDGNSFGKLFSKSINKVKWIQTIGTCFALPYYLPYVTVCPILCFSLFARFSFALHVKCPTFSTFQNFIKL